MKCVKKFYQQDHQNLCRVKFGKKLWIIDLYFVLKNQFQQKNDRHRITFREGKPTHHVKLGNRAHAPYQNVGFYDSRSA